tara:strand:+ start:6989 stop:7549 length:561 start_codon:yes stop_codon:yes gene_type:complete
MIPSNGIVSIYAKIIGDQSLLSIAQGNLLGNIERVGKARTHTFMAFNGQTEHGVSHNYGSDRYYSWEDTIIDCRNAPNLVDSDGLQDWFESFADNRRFLKFKNDLENRMGGHISVTPYHSILRGEDNMRYNIKRRSKIEDFDTIRVGIRLTAADDDAFQAGLHALKDCNNPFKIKPRMMEPNLQMA